MGFLPELRGLLLTLGYLFGGNMNPIGVSLGSLLYALLQGEILELICSFSISHYLSLVYVHHETISNGIGSLLLGIILVLIGWILGRYSLGDPGS